LIQRPFETGLRAGDKTGALYLGPGSGVGIYAGVQLCEVGRIRLQIDDLMLEGQLRTERDGDVSGKTDPGPVHEVSATYLLLKKSEPDSLSIGAGA
jgi:hypothetical protein